MKNFNTVIASLALSTLLAVPMSAFALDLGSTVSAAVQVTCKDGSQSKGGQGACSGHGGVNKAAANAHAAAADAKADVKAVKADAKATKTQAKAGVMTSMESAKSSATSAKVNAKTELSVQPTGATAKCKDGTFSMAKGHSGACSHHGGVAEFIK